MDVQWQKQFQSRGESVPEMDSDLDLTDSDEPVGLFGLHSMEPCV